MRGGVVSGAIGPLSVGAMEYGAVDTSAPVSSSTGQAVNDPFKTSGNTNAKVTGGRRRRKTKKAKGGKRRKTRKMKGGAWTPGNVNAAGVGYGFTGPDSGIRGGIAPASGYPSRVGGAPMGADGVRSA